MKLERITIFLAIFLVAGAFVALYVMQDRANYGLADSNNLKNLSEAEIVISDKQIVFRDEFDSEELNTTLWATCYDWRLSSETGCTNYGNFEKQWYVKERLKVENGVLDISAIKKSIDVAVQKEFKTFDFQSGMINSGSGGEGAVRWSGVYGYYEAKIKFDKGQGIWPAFWLLPVDREWPPEIDIMEFIGGKPGEILQTIHWREGSKAAKSDHFVKENEDYSGDWHVYGVNWYEDGIDWYIDGKKTRSYTGSNVPDEPMEIIINLAVGGTLPGDPDESTLFPRHMQVDYVRVYQSSEQIRPSNN